MKRIVVHIERLTLRGIDSGDREAIIAGLCGQLEQLLHESEARQGLLARGNVAFSRPDTLHLSRESSADQLGRRLAEAVCGLARNSNL